MRRSRKKKEEERAKEKRGKRRQISSRLLQIKGREWLQKAVCCGLFGRVCVCVGSRFDLACLFLLFCSADITLQHSRAPDPGGYDSLQGPGHVFFFVFFFMGGKA